MVCGCDRLRSKTLGKSEVGVAVYCDATVSAALLSDR